MNVADEATSAHLKAGVQDYPTIGALPAQSAIHFINECFKRWGLPKQIKIDNGHPFVTPGYIDVPTKSKLWWIGLGIKVIQNKLRSPQENGVVECLQGIMNNWSNPKKQNSIEALQSRLDKESDFQRNHYRIPAKGNKTRIELYPGLQTNPRNYNPNKFDMNLVYNFLSEQVWNKTINASGNISIMGKAIYVSYKMKRHPVTVTFDPSEKIWLIRKEDGTLLQKSVKGVPTEKQIKDFAILSKNFHPT